MPTYTVQFPDETDKVLQEMSRKQDVDKKEILRRAIALYKYLEEELDKGDGNKLVIADKDDKPVKEVVIRKKR